MQLFDVYKHKDKEDIIQISSFATRMDTHKDMFIVFERIFNNGGSYGSAPGFNGYGTQAEIEAEYELLVPREQLENYRSWEEIFKLIENEE